jgi:ribosomal protein L37AE/L43A
MMCPKCGETRLIERVDGLRWFCAICAHSWTIGAKDGDSPSEASREMRERFIGNGVRSGPWHDDRERG